MGGSASREDDYTANENVSDKDHTDSRPETPPRLADEDRKVGSMSNIATTEFIWGFGGHSVFVTGAWDDWRVKVALSRTSPNDFVAVLALPLGRYQYKFIVDGNWKHNPSLPTERDQHGNLNNIVAVKPQIPEYDSNVPLHYEQLSTSPVESYDFSLLPQEDHTTEPPTLPRLLSRAPFDNLTGTPCDGTDFVRLNHMFATRCDSIHGSDEVRTLATELRYKSKVVKTILIAAKNPVPLPMNLAALRAYPQEPTQQIAGPTQSIPSVPPSLDESRSLIMDALNNV